MKVQVHFREGFELEVFVLSVTGGQVRAACYNLQLTALSCHRNVRPLGSENLPGRSQLYRNLAASKSCELEFKLKRTQLKFNIERMTEATHSCTINRRIIVPLI